MQQPAAGGAGGSQTHYGGAGEMSAAEAAAAEQGQLVVEAASPISSRPPASAAVNLDELMTLSGAAAAAEDALADRGGGGGSTGNRWPRQETLALLKIRSDMDVAFRDATLKGPLWEDVSRKLAELGYRRNAKKCKEKFENVHKYYKRTKEGRAGRQDGKSYKFFSELEALHGTAATAAATTANVSASPAVHAASPNPVSVGLGSASNPMPISSFRMSHQQQPPSSTAIPIIPSSQPTATPTDFNFSSNSSSTSPGTDDDDDDDDAEGERSSRKRKRGSASTSTGISGGGSTRKMMDFFEVLMKQVMQKQESMQQRFLEVIEKREQDRTIREEAWKRQEMARLTREQELMSQERAISASRDAAIISFLQKITGQTIQLPPPVNVHAAPPPPVPPSVSVVTPLPQTTPQPTTQTYQTPQQQQPQPPQQMQQVRHVQQTQAVQPVMAVPEQQVPPTAQENIGSGGGGGSSEPASSSRWPKAEVLALIKLRSGLESRYQDAGPKGPLWEEISAGMGRMGYNRSCKRCKEKWENINKYFKKVKESNKKRPEDAKTCPYFHELDALYRKRVLGGGSTGGSSSSLGNRLEQQPQQPEQEQVVAGSENKNADDSTDVETNLRANLFGEGTEEAAKKPEDIVKELMEVHDHQQVLQQGHPQHFGVDDCNRVEEADSDNLMDQEEEDMEDEDMDEEDDEETEQERKMAYKIEFQKQNTGPSSNGGGNGAPSFLAMVQ
ncbi:hypothetical protein ACFX1Q_015861 [Malus domestica]|uniref:trihelix transcription factor GTL1-like isoform X1 n=1 Tax=Malus domestica TaxID=3750 RepID=UPI003976539A